MLRIGVTGSLFHEDKERITFNGKSLLFVEEGFMSWMAKGECLPYLVPRAVDPKNVVADIDALMITGGADISPKSYGEDAIKPEWSGDYERDQYEIALFQEALAQQKPVLGVCRGHQIINVGLGGTMYQDILTQKDDAHLHRDADIYDELKHDITIEPGSILSKIYGGVTEGHVNSVHHQAIKDLGRGLRVEARSIPDQIIEAVYLDDPAQFVLGVQWHPEWVRDDKILSADTLRDYFLSEVQRRK